MARITLGAVVQLHYVGKLEDGTIFDSTSKTGPIKLHVGAGTLPEAFEHLLIGMEAGEKKSFRLASADAFGPRDEGLIRHVPRSEIEGERVPQVGDRLRAGAPDGTDLMLTVTAVGDDTITIDGNHPLAGKDLSFDIEVVSIVTDGPKS